jgi:hypothetical protein
MMRNAPSSNINTTTAPAANTSAGVNEYRRLPEITDPANHSTRHSAVLAHASIATV